MIFVLKILVGSPQQTTVNSLSRTLKGPKNLFDIEKDRDREDRTSSPYINGIDILRSDRNDLIVLRFVKAFRSSLIYVKMDV